MVVKEQKYGTTFFNDAFVIRLQNKRITCLKQDGGWEIVSEVFRKEKEQKGDRKYFARLTCRLGGLYTVHRVRYTDQALNLISMGVIEHISNSLKKPT